MATGPALPLTGTLIGADARYWAQDQDTTNPAVSAADLLLRINDRLVWWQHNVESRPKTIAATTSGLTFSAGTCSVVCSADLGIVAILSAHQAGSNALDFPLSPELQRVSVQEMYEMHSRTPGQTLSGQSQYISHWSAEKDQNNPDEWRVTVYPVPSADVYLTIRGTISNTLSAIGETADVSPASARIIARMVGYDMAGVQKQNDPDYLAWVLSGVPREIREKMFGQAKFDGAQQARVDYYG